MSYESKTIHQIITEIDANKFYLPALQRKFVWDEDRITLLFDSILRGYPISTFLFWVLKKQKANEYVFYKFLDRYDERDPYNRRRDGPFTHDEITGVLDGQQRLSSLYIGLMGKYISKDKYKHSKNPDAYTERTLYINLLNTPYILDHSESFSKVVIDEEKNFEIKFLGDSQVINSQMHFWVRFGEIIKWNSDTSPTDVFETFIQIEQNPEILKSLNDNRRTIIKTIESLRDNFIKEPIITFFKTDKEDLEAILNIFIRVNSGAMMLTKSDLLFSTIIATWEYGREEIELLQKKINNIGDGFNFSNEFIMRSLLVLSDLPILFKVNSFTNENVKSIKSNWDKIQTSLIRTVEILNEFGFNEKLIPSQNAVIPIAYYIYKGGLRNKETKIELVKYLKSAFFSGVFGGQGDEVLKEMRNALRIKDDLSDSYTLKTKSFSFDDFNSKLKLTHNKSLSVTEKRLDELLDESKSSYTFLLLSLIYPNYKYGQVKLHQDHIHPYASFTKTKIKSFGLNDPQIEDWLKKRDKMPNLQLLEGTENQSKNDTAFSVWLESSCKDESELESVKKKNRYLLSNYIDPTLSLELKDFEQFYSVRKESMKNALKLALGLPNSNTL